MLQSFGQVRPLAWACVLVRFSTRSMLEHVATRWPNACNMFRPTMLRSVGFKCCDRLAGACKYWANNVGVCCLEMLLSFGRGFKHVPNDGVVRAQNKCEIRK